MKTTNFIFFVFLLFFCSTSIAQVDLKNGLLGMWYFNGDPNDNSGNINHGTVFGAKLTTDRFDNPESAYEFDGIDDYILIPYRSRLFPTAEMAISVWVCVSDLTHRHFIVDKRINVYTPPYSSFVIYASNSSTAQVWSTQITTSWDFSVSTNTQAITEPNKWYHLLLNYDGYTIDFYANGELQNSAKVSGNLIYSRMGMYLGTSALNTFFLKGKIDDVRLYNRALNTDEIDALYSEKNSVNKK